jgi:ferredoxin
MMKKLVHDRSVCLACAGCVGVCPKMALDMYGLDLQIDPEKCVRCGICVKACPVGALKITEVDNA